MLSPEGRCLYSNTRSHMQVAACAPQTTSDLELQELQPALHTTLPPYGVDAVFLSGSATYDPILSNNPGGWWAQLCRSQAITALGMPQQQLVHQGSL